MGQLKCRCVYDDKGNLVTIGICKNGQDCKSIKSEYPTKKAAFNQAKRDAKVPKTQQPQKVKNAKMIDQNGNSVLDDNKQPIETKEYHYTSTDGKLIVIQNHSEGHEFKKDGKIVNTEGPHFNVRPLTNKRTGKVLGTQVHYRFKK